MGTLRLRLLTSTVTVLATSAAWSQPPPPAQPPKVAENGVEVLTRGPLHEAFAEMISFDPQPGIVVATSPPEAIEEVAPAQRPEGDNVAWIPGYWAWDDERNDFLWVSGIWRALPPSRQWVPGYWGRAPQGFQWTSGYWADAAATEVDYLPEPPATIETGPSVAASSADETWFPGHWSWQQNRYAWSPGYWDQGHKDWDWIPAHYVWTPRGYVFVDGYYDYAVARRGVVFAPVQFYGGLQTTPGYSYSPSAVINSSVLTRHLFLRPSYGHYYFGDYYSSNYERAGYAHSHSYHSSRRGYDPIYARQHWHHRGDRQWEQRAESNFRRLRDHETSRPPRDWAAQQAILNQQDASFKRNAAVVSDLTELAQRNRRLRFQSVDAAERQQHLQRSQDYRTYLQQRQQLESRAAHRQRTDADRDQRPPRAAFSRSPYAGRSDGSLSGEFTPPRRHARAEAALNTQPQARTPSGTSVPTPLAAPAASNQRNIEQARRESGPGKRGNGSNAGRQQKSDTPPGRGAQEKNPGR